MVQLPISFRLIWINPMIRDLNFFRAWGDLGDVLPGSSSGSWAFIGCASMEPRSTTAYLSASERIDISEALVFRFTVPKSRFADRVDELALNNLRSFRDLGVSNSSISEFPLLGSFEPIAQSLLRFLNNSTAANLAIDISSMPKRVFFFLIGRAMRNFPKFHNIVVTYSEPLGYSHLPLAENPDRWNTLPGFDAPAVLPSRREIVISIGYEPLGLPDLVSSGEFENSRVHLLFPFPSLPERVRKNWQFARDLYPNLVGGSVHIHHADGMNLPDIYDFLSRVGDAGDTCLTLAPFGPKPISLAMALYASRYSAGPNQTSVYYTQPTTYNPEYSFGVREMDGVKKTNCYIVRRLGTDLY